MSIVAAVLLMFLLLLLHCGLNCTAEHSGEDHDEK